jgi:hypothetical protein
MYAFDFICVAIILYFVFENSMVRALFIRQQLVTQILIVNAVLSLLIGVLMAFKETEFVAAALGGSAAWFLHGILILVSVGGGLWSGTKISERFQYRTKYLGVFLGICLGVAVFFFAGVALKFVFGKIPGVGWRLEKQMSYIKYRI